MKDNECRFCRTPLSADNHIYFRDGYAFCESGCWSEYAGKYGNHDDERGEDDREDDDR